MPKNNIKNSDDLPISENEIGIPQNLSAIAGSERFTLSWDLVDKADGYRIFQYYPEEDKYYGIKYTKNLKKSIVNFKNGVEYHFKVCAYRIINGQEVYGDLSESISVVLFNYDLKINRSVIVLKSGDSVALECTIMDEKQNVKWHSSDENIVTVDNNGLVTAIAKGNAVISAKDEKDKVTSKVIVDRDAPEPLSEIMPARYQKNDNGYYTNTNSNQSNIAKIMIVGDLMALGSQQKAVLQENGSCDFRNSFKYVQHYFKETDLVIGNLETTLSQSFTYGMEENKYLGQPNCNAPSTFLDALRYAGIDSVVTSNNHSCDSGPRGIFETLEHLKRYQIPNTGSFISPGSQRFLLFDVNSIKLAIMSYNELSYNGKDVLFNKDELSFMTNSYSKNRLTADIVKAREMGAEFIIVYMHWGKQNSINVNKSQIKCAKELADSGVDLIIGSHPHVLQRFDTIISSDNRNVPVMYSLGNFFSSMSQVSANRDTIIMQFELIKIFGFVKIKSISYLSCTILDDDGGDPYVITPVITEYGRSEDGQPPPGMQNMV